MFNTPEFARDMKRGEEAQVDALLLAAFGGPEEAELVAKLRKARLIAGEQVMPMGGADSRLLCAFKYGQTQRLVVSGASGHRARCAATWVWQAHDRHVDRMGADHTDACGRLGRTCIL